MICPEKERAVKIIKRVARKQQIFIVHDKSGFNCHWNYKIITSGKKLNG